MITLGPPRPRRRMSLTPMIDVVFLLLIFFMLAARFGVEGGLALSGGTGGDGWSGPPRLVDFAPEGLWLNGVPLASDSLSQALAPLMQAADEPIILRPRDGANLQHLTDLSERLLADGFTRLILVEP
jgi:biopolymer transport protein ExbD